jgi:hypothetical protein
MKENEMNAEHSMTPDAFVGRVSAVVDELALALSNTPSARQEEALNRFAERVRPRWSEVFSPALSDEDVDGMVADFVDRVRTKRNALETLEPGTA